MTTSVTKKLSVAAIRNGSVLDHIEAGNALRIIRLLDLAKHGRTVTVGLNLPSAELGMKDLIKVEGREISEAEASRIAILAPSGTVNVIREYEVVQKYRAAIPRVLENVIVCPNSRCICNHSKMSTLFFVEKRGERIRLVCKYCRNHFEQNEIREYHT